MECADTFKKDTIFKDFLVLNVHENANRKPSSSERKTLGSPENREFHESASCKFLAKSCVLNIIHVSKRQKFRIVEFLFF